jgi:hypothetical protein
LPSSYAAATDHGEDERIDSGERSVEEHLAHTERAVDHRSAVRITDI